jgi:hypothetical protein
MFELNFSRGIGFVVHSAHPTLSRILPGHLKIGQPVFTEASISRGLKSILLRHLFFSWGVLLSVSFILYLVD